MRKTRSNRNQRRLQSCLLAGLLLLPSWTGTVLGEEADIRRDATVAAVDRVLPSVVNIATETIVEYRDWYQQLLREFYNWNSPPGRRSLVPSSLGSGVIIDEEGYVLTNLHVVRRAARTWVKLWDGRVREADRIVALPRSDVALLKLKAEPGETFQAIKFAKDDDLLLGETVLALGNPFGLGGSVSRGILSSKNRRPLAEGEPLSVQDWLQSDAAINPGNSGGPLINLHGELIGLNVAVHREGQGIGFAIPVRQVSEALSEFFMPEVSHGLWLGARVKHASYPLLITAVQSGSPAEKAGLRVGDRFLQVNQHTPDDLVSLSSALDLQPPHDATLVVERDGKRLTLKARLVPYPDLIRQKIGLSFQELTASLAEQFGFRERQGLLIAGVDPGSPADKAGLQHGHLVTGINGESVSETLHAGGLLSQIKSGERVRLNVLVPRRSGNFVTYQQAVVEARVK